MEGVDQQLLRTVILFLSAGVLPLITEVAKRYKFLHNNSNAFTIVVSTALMGLAWKAFSGDTSHLTEWLSAGLAASGLSMGFYQSAKNAAPVAHRKVRDALGPPK